MLWTCQATSSSEKTLERRLRTSSGADSQYGDQLPVRTGLPGKKSRGWWIRHRRRPDLSCVEWSRQVRRRVRTELCRSWRDHWPGRRMPWEAEGSSENRGRQIRQSQRRGRRSTFQGLTGWARFAAWSCCAAQTHSYLTFTKKCVGQTAHEGTLSFKINLESVATVGCHAMDMTQTSGLTNVEIFSVHRPVKVRSAEMCKSTLCSRLSTFECCFQWKIACLVNFPDVLNLTCMTCMTCKTCTTCMTCKTCTTCMTHRFARSLIGK